MFSKVTAAISGDPSGFILINPRGSHILTT